MKTGDVVLWLERESVSSRPKRKSGYSLGKVEKVTQSSSGDVVFVVGVDGSQHVVFERFVKVVEGK